MSRMVQTATDATFVEDDAPQDSMSAKAASSSSRNRRRPPPSSMAAISTRFHKAFSITTEDPGQWPLPRRVLMTVAVILATVLALSDGTLYTTAHDALAAEFRLDESHFSKTYWPITSWGVGAALFSVVLLPLAEDFGVKRVLTASWALMTIWIIPQAAARNFATIIVTRFFVGGFVGVVANAAVTILVALWPDKRVSSHVVGTWVTSYIMGGSIGPVIGSGIYARSSSWRWTFIAQIIYYACMLPLLFLILHEVRPPTQNHPPEKVYGAAQLDMHQQITMSRWQRNRQQLHVLWISVRRPITMLCTEPMVTVSATWSAFMLGTTYLFTQSVEQVFVALYGWTPIQAGYAQAAVVIGELLGLSGVVLNNYLYFASARTNKEQPGEPLPEARLYTAVPGGIFVSAGMFIYAWTSYAQLPWIAPALGLALSGCGVVWVVNGLADYMVDSYTFYAASAMGALALGENLFIAFLPLAAQAMYTNMGFHWASSALALISLALTSIAIIIIYLGSWLRQRSPYVVQTRRRASEDTKAGSTEIDTEQQQQSPRADISAA